MSMVRHSIPPYCCGVQGPSYLLYMDLFLSISNLEKRVYELNTSARRIRILSAVSLMEQTVVPVVKSKVTEVNQYIFSDFTKFYVFLFH